MIFKRTKMVTKLKTAVQWLDSYADEERKHGGKQPEAGLSKGTHYVTTRPNGTVSAHGYLKPKIDLIKAVHQLDAKAAIRYFLQEHDADLKRKRRKILALRAVVSLKPDILQRAFERRIDLDRLLVRAVEHTAKAVSTKYYNGEELGYFLGIHHDRHHIHGHLFLLPYTAKDRRINMSNDFAPVRTRTDFDHKQDNILDAWRTEYALTVNHTIYALIAAKRHTPTPLTRTERVRIAESQLIADKVDQEMQAIKTGVNPPVITELRRRLLGKYQHYTQTFTPQIRENLYRQLCQRNAELQAQLAQANQTREYIAQYVHDCLDDAEDVRKDRAAEIAEFLATYKRDCCGPITARDGAFPTFSARPANADPSVHQRLHEFFAYQRTRRQVRRVGNLRMLADSNAFSEMLTGQKPDDFVLLEEEIAAAKGPYRVTEATPEEMNQHEAGQTIPPPRRPGILLPRVGDAPLH